MGGLRQPDHRVAVRRFADLVRVPWRNGGGITREVARPAEESGAGEPRWRVSIADLETDGLFSRFPGRHRLAVLADLAAVELTVDGGPHVLDSFVPFAFDGAATTSARLLTGPARLLNVMTSEVLGVAVIDVVRGGSIDIPADDRATYVVVLLDGVAAVVLPASEATVLGPLDSVLLSASMSATIDVGSGVAAVVQLP